MYRFIVLFSLCFVSTVLGAKVDLKGTLLCSKDPKVGCGLSSAAIARIGKTPYLLAPNDQDGTLYFYKLASFEKASDAFMERLEPTFSITPPIDYFVKKLEGVTVVGDWIILMGAYHSSDGQHDGNRKIVAVRLDDQGKPLAFQQIAGPELHQVLANTVQKFDDIDGPIPTFLKLEAITTIPVAKGKYKIIIGVRTQWEGETRQYVIRLLISDLTQEGDKLILAKTWKPLMDMKQKPGYGVSDITYDAMTKTVQMLTSLEEKTKDKEVQNGALWTISAKDLLKGKDTFVEVPGTPFEGCKAEGAAVFSKRTIVLCDDDRATPMMLNGRARKTDESPFFVVDTKAK